MSQREVVAVLQQHARVEPEFTSLVWEKLEEQNAEFFAAYHARLRLKDQILSFNALLEQFAALGAARARPAHTPLLPSLSDFATATTFVPARPHQPGLLGERYTGADEAHDHLFFGGLGGPSFDGGHAGAPLQHTPLPSPRGAHGLPPHSAGGAGFAAPGYPGHAFGGGMQGLPRVFSLSDLGGDLAGALGAGPGGGMEDHISLLAGLDTGSHGGGGEAGGGGGMRRNGSMGRLPHSLSLSDIGALFQAPQGHL